MTDILQSITKPKKQEKRTYIEVEEDLKNLLNTKRLNSNIGQQFYNLIIELKKDYNIGITTKFLRTLMGEKTPREQTKRISYVLNKAGLISEKSSRFFKGWVYQKYNAKIKDFTKDKNFKPISKKFKTELVKGKGGFIAVSIAEYTRNPDNNDKVSILKSEKTQSVSKCFIANNSEVMHKIQTQKEARETEKRLMEFELNAWN